MRPSGINFHHRQRRFGASGRGDGDAAGRLRRQRETHRCSGYRARAGHHQLHGSSTLNSRTCLATVTSSGTYRITGGTGRYRHVRGHGRYRLTAYAIVGKVHGKCTTKVVPYAQETLLTASGPIQG